jgi:membrane protein required for colicin V production
MTFTVLDFILLGLVAIIIIRCTVRGLIEEVMSIAALVLGLAGAFLLFRTAAVFIRTKINMQIVPEILAFVGIFVVIFILVKIIEGMLADIIARIHLGWLDRLLGFLFGLVEASALLILILFVIYVQPVFKGELLLENSFFARLILPLIGAIRLSFFSGAA